MLSFEQQPSQQPNQQNGTAQPQLLQQQPNQTMRLREDPPPINPPSQPATASRSRKRKSPADQSISQDNPATTQPPPPGQQITPQLLSTHPGLLQHYPFPPPEFNPNHSPGMSPTGPLPGPPATDQQSQQQAQSQQQGQAGAAANRALSNSKRAEQNRKAQRAFRERRDQ